MAVEFKVQYIRSCKQCGTVLSMKCKACVKHPDRKPTIVEVYDWPPILATCPSGDCIQIACQKPGCTGKPWRSRSHTRGGKMKSAHMYCTRQCNLSMIALSKRIARVKVPCGWCRAPVERTESQLKLLKSAYCRPDHYFLFLKKAVHEAKQALKAETSPDRALLHCVKCKDVTEHKAPSKGNAICLTCNGTRTQSGTAMPMMETQKLKYAEKSLVKA